jgi:hypothetical protein
VYKEILEQAIANRRPYDHIGWRGICTKCGIDYNIFGEEVKKKYGDTYKDMKSVEVRCKRTECNGLVKVLYKMKEERAIHLTSIARRK